MKKLFIFTFIACFLVQLSTAGEKEAGYKIDISAPQLKNQSINLAMHFYGKLYAKDTLMLDEKGNGSFQNKKALAEGLYAVYFSSSKFFDIIIADDQEFKIKIDTTDLINNVQITGAIQTEAFNDFVKFISSKKTDMMKIQEEFETKKDDPEAKKTLEDKMKIFDKEVTEYQQNLANSYQNKTLGKIIKALIPIRIPEDLTAENDSILQIKKYYYNRKHYFDNINLSDPTMLYTNILAQKIDFYIEKMLPQIPDTITTEVIQLIEKSKNDTLTFQNMTSNMLNYSIKSKLMGMDKLLLEISERYYLSGKANWADSTLMADLEKEVKKIKYNQIGSKAANLTVENFDGLKVSLYNTQADFILLYFFEPNCGHCKKETPKLYDTVYQKYKNKNFEVFAFYTQTDKEEWAKFITEHKLYDWMNVWDPKRESYFWHFYDTSTTPGLYLINKERKIVAKKIDLQTLDMILEKELEKE